ncbi:LysR family transcriptional regulator [Tabrizicola sp.]|jgi:LysR family glycine cleavage system transcriptional activator|uniref:LysR family transcriptional regulator n=2 Tax=Tabrizicola sp. TaxID=2005166 RepID=UPI001A5858D9|nr:LysR family transcriptional regulator [Tabrizicola sp.]MBL9062253.1 LysR family transcriptional regulator [Tabrizicola sp.]
MPVAPPPLTRLPLNALRAFEAAARTGAFTLAAAELGVTPGAVTAHVKALEERLGAALFERQARGVRLTALGLAAVEELTGAFDALAGAEARMRALALPREVHIATLPAIAQLWLSPRLPALRAAAPEISVSITALEAPPNLKRSLHDLSLFPGTSGGRLVAEDALFPVCSPALAARLRQVEDLAGVPCLSDTAWDRDWEVWLAAAGAQVAVRGPVFSLYALAVEEAVNGAGVLIGHGPLVAGHLERGTLVAPFPRRVSLAAGFRLWSARPMQRGGAVERVAEFLAGQAKAA